MFLDASAIVAMLTDEPEGAAFRQAVAAEPDPITSAVAVYESALAIARRKGREPDVAHEIVVGFLASAEIRTVQIGDAEHRLAVQAFARFGKGRGRPAQLNMGDCFAYACAKVHSRSLLFKGDDFSRTDIQSA
jgi:ribonuclease VapC